MTGTAVESKARGSTRGASASGRQQRAAAVSLCSNIFLVTIKLAAGFATGSVSVLAEGVQSLLDVIASAVILIMVRAAAAPPDPRHPYGHGKFENITSLGQIALILSSAGFILTEAWRHILHPEPLKVGWGVAALGTALVVNTVVSRWMHKVAVETGSQALEAEALHLRGDMLSCVGVLGGLGLVALTGQPRVDPIVAAVMTLVVMASALRLMRDTLRPLLDESLPPTEEAQVRSVLDGNSNVLGYHRLRTRRAGAHRLMDVHILLDDGLSFSGAHAISEEVEDEIREVLPNVDVIVHAEPFEEETRHQHERHRPG